MTHDEEVTYLANIMSIACSDAKLSPVEQEALQAVVQQRRLGGAVVQEARDLVDAGAYRLRILSSQADRMANLEDMVLVALADGKLHSKEASPIEKASELLRLSQADMDMIVARAQGRLHRLKLMRDKGRGPPPLPAELLPGQSPPPLPSRRPPAREAPPPTPPVAKGMGPGVMREPPRPIEPPRPMAPPGLMESPHAPEVLKPAGSAAANPASPPVPVPVEAPAAPAAPDNVFPVPERGIAVFVVAPDGGGRPEYEDLLLGADKVEEATVGGRPWVGGVWSEERIDHAAAFAIEVAGLQHREIFVHGKRREWDEVFGFARCAWTRLKSKYPQGHCFGAPDGAFNPWGCRLAGMDWAAGADWFCEGRFRSDEEFEFDKAALCRLLEKQLDHVRYCPFLNQRLMNAVLEVMPASVDVWGRWRYQEANAAGEASRAISVREYLHGIGLTRRTHVKGVEPTDLNTGIKLLQRAAHACGAGMPAVSMLRECRGPMPGA